MWGCYVNINMEGHGREHIISWSIVQDGHLHASRSSLRGAGGEFCLGRVTDLEINNGEKTCIRYIFIFIFIKCISL